MTEMVILLIICIAIISYVLISKYKKSTYYLITRQSYFKVHFDKGLYGEYLTYKKLKPFEKEGARLLFNCYLPKEDGKTTEIDTLLISRSGVYVFESKNYSGWIFGKENAKTWTQTLPQGRGKRAHKEHFLNPVFQNKLHIKCLENILENKLPVHSVIVFSERCVFKDLDIHNANVVQRFNLKRKVNQIDEQFGNVLSAEAIEHIYNQLYPYTQVSSQIKTEHIAAVKQKLESPKSEPQGSGSSSENHNSAPICPRCGNIMVLRTAKKGSNTGKQFFGCSNYPSCKAIQSIEEKGALDVDKNDTLQYYNEFAKQFSEDTIAVDFRAHQERFLKHLEPGARILDYGCGSGRDTKYFLNRGYQVDAIDGSEELVKHASEYTGIAVKHMLFQDLNSDGIYDGIWACASILHLNREDLTKVFYKIGKALVSKGILYTSFKYGTGELIRDGRFYMDMTEEKLKSFPVVEELFVVVEEWKSVDVRPERESENWLNIILQKKN